LIEPVDPVIETYGPPVTVTVPLSEAQEAELRALNAILTAGDGVLRVARIAGKTVGRSLLFVRISELVERTVLAFSGPGMGAKLRGMESAFLTDLVVAEDRRGRGIGTRLVRDALRLTFAAGLARLTLEVRRENLGALRIYERLGFELRGDGDVVTCTRLVVGG
jgi:ribosomal protein S18 acetylase RimI-like enzyme